MRKGTKLRHIFSGTGGQWVYDGLKDTNLSVERAATMGAQGEAVGVEQRLHGRSGVSAALLRKLQQREGPDSMVQRCHRDRVGLYAKIADP